MSSLTGHQTSKRSGFTLIELLVVIAIISLLKNPVLT
jgi:prepilin-type N-terminal cleavage/methylation domain-containing protein